MSANQYILNEKISVLILFDCKATFTIPVYLLFSLFLKHTLYLALWHNHSVASLWPSICFFWVLSRPIFLYMGFSWKPSPSIFLSGLPKRFHLLKIKIPKSKISSTSPKRSCVCVLLLHIHPHFKPSPPLSLCSVTVAFLHFCDVARNSTHYRNLHLVCLSPFFAEFLLIV